MASRWCHWSVCLFLTIEVYGPTKCATMTAQKCFLNGQFSASFLYFRLFYKQWIVNNCSIKFALTGFEPRSSGIGSDHAVNCATTTSQTKSLCRIYWGQFRSRSFYQKKYRLPDASPTPVWPVKSCQMSLNLPKNDFTRKLKDFDTFTKIS